MKKIVDNYGNPIWKGAKVVVGRSEGVLKGTVEVVNPLDSAISVRTTRGLKHVFANRLTEAVLCFEDILVLNPEEKPQSISIPKILENFLLEEGGEILLLMYTTYLKECKGNIDDIARFFKNCSVDTWIGSAFPWPDSEYWNKIDTKWNEMFSCTTE